MDEFVALSEERTKEIIREVHEEVYGRCMPDTNTADWYSGKRIASEASENTKRWLMEKVCQGCGEPGDCDCKVWPWSENQPPRRTRAEYLSRTEGR